MRCISHILAATLAVACSRSPDSPPAPVAPAAASRQPTAVEELDRMDQRAPVPLLPHMAAHQKQNMREHLVAVQQVVAALALADFAAVEQAAAAIGFSESMGKMCSHMGAGAPGFADRAVEFHHTADGIGAAARARDGAAVLTALGTTLSACTSCHAAWKQQVVDESTWHRVSSLASGSESR